MPNVGKSTLMNKLVGERLSIMTPKAGTTRHRILGILNGDDYQLVYSDTPGIYSTPQYKLHEGMMAAVKGSLNDADVVLLLIDVFQVCAPAARRSMKMKVISCCWPCVRGPHTLLLKGSTTCGDALTCGCLWPLPFRAGVVG